MFHNVYSLSYWLANKVFSNKEIPIFSAVINISIIQIFTIDFLFELLVYQTYHRRDLTLNSEKIGYILITIILILNWMYYSKHSNEILKKFETKNEKLIYKVIFITYIFMLIISTILMSISIRNNDYWF